MVFESVVAEVLNRFIGSYVDNLDRSQLKLDIWSGNIVLQKLNLKENAFDGMNLPIKVVSGSLSKLVMQIPWSNLYNAPVIVNVEGLSVLAVPNLIVKYDQKTEEAIRVEAKRKLIEAYENSQKNKENTDVENSTGNSFVEKLSAQIIKNVQITIANIHIRYEDDLTNPQLPLAVGITLYSVFIKSTDSDWNEKITGEDQRRIFKVVSLDSLAIYFNTVTKMYSHVDRSEHCDLFASTIVSSTTPPPLGYMYLFGPIKLMSRLCIDPKPEIEQYVSPKIWFSVEMQCVQLSISRRQYRSLTELFCSVQRMSTASKYRKYRPNDSLSENPKLCWHYAYRVILNEVVRRRRRNWSWVHMSAYREIGRRYQQAYRTKLTSKKVSADVIARISDCEYKLDLVNLIAIRQRVEAEVGSKRSEERSGGGGWFSGWFSGSNPDPDQSEDDGITNRLRTALTDEERDKLYAAIDYNGENSPSELPVHYESVHMSFSLDSLVFLLLDDSDTREDSQQVICARLNKFSAKINQRPASNGARLSLDIVELRVDGVVESVDGDRPTLVSTQAIGDERLLSVVFETNPLSESGNDSTKRPCDSRLRVNGKPLKITFHSVTLQKVAAIFEPPQHVQLTQLQDAALSRFHELRHASALRLQTAIDTRHRLDVSVDLMAPLLIVPQQGMERRLLALRLGQLLVVSKPYESSETSVAVLSRAGSSPEQIYENLAEKVYDRFRVQLSDMEVAVAGSAESSVISDIAVADWRNIRLVQPVSLSLDLGRCVIVDDPRLPLIQLHMRIPLFELSFSDQRLCDLAAIINSLSPSSSTSVSSGQSQGYNSRSHSNNDVFTVPKHGVGQQVLPDQTKVASADELIQFQASFCLSKFSVRLLNRSEFAPFTYSESLPITDAHYELARFFIIDSNFSLKQRIKSMEANGSVDRVFMECPEFEIEEDDVVAPVVLLACGNHDCPVLNLQFYNNEQITNSQLADSERVDQNLELNIGNIDVHIHQQSVCSLISFFSKLGAQLSVATSEVENEDPICSSRSPSASTAAASRPGEAVVSRVQASCSCLQLRLSTGEQQVMKARLDGITATYTLTHCSRRLQLQLGTASVMDMMLQRAAPCLLTADEELLLSADVWLYDHQTTPHSETLHDVAQQSVDVKLHMRVGGVKLMLVKRFLSDLAEFGAPFGAQQQMLASASHQAADKAQQAVQTAYERALRLRVDVVVRAPLLVVPQTSDSHFVLLADFGKLSVSNSLNLDGDDIYDDVVLCLDDVKLSTAQIDLDCLITEHSLSIETERDLLSPVSFAVNLRRCLTVANGTAACEMEITADIQRFSVTLDNDSYQQLMATLAGNLSESAMLETCQVAMDAGVASDESAVRPTVVEVSRATRVEISGESDGGVWLKFRLDWCLVGVELCVRHQDSGVCSSFGRLSVMGLNVHGQSSRNGQLECRVTLDDCVLEDSRLEVRTEFRRLMHKLVDAGHDEVNTGRLDTNSSLFSVHYCQETSADCNIDICINRVSLILYLPYFMALGDFFTCKSSVSRTGRASVTRSRIDMSTSRAPRPDSLRKPSTDSASTGCTKLKLIVRRPDIALVENIDAADTRAVIFHAEIQLSAILGSGGVGSSMFDVELTSIRLFTCRYSPSLRASTTAEIVSAFDVGVSSRQSGGQDCRVAVSASPLSLHMNSASISLLSSLSATLASAASGPAQPDQSPPPDYSNVWECRPVTASSFWFMVCEVAEEADQHSPTSLSADGAATVSQELQLNLESITVTVEQTLGSRHVPLVMLDSCVDAKISNWGSILSVNASFSVEMNYYNSGLSVWEPVIDRVEQLNSDNLSLIPLKFMVEVKRGSGDDSTPSLLPSPSECSTVSTDSEDTKLQTQIASIVVCVRAENQVQLTVSRTFLQTLVSLQSSMADAFDPLNSSTVSVGGRSSLAQLVVLNCLADLLIVQPNSVYTCGDRAIDEILVNPDGQAELFAATAPLGSGSSVSAGFVSVQVPSLGVHVEVPLARAEPRYYRVPAGADNAEPWGLVCDVTANSDCRTVSVRSIIQLDNHLHTDVHVYYRVGDACLQCDGVVAPGQCMALSLAAVYATGGELFFSPANYAVSTRPYTWRSLLSSKQHQLKLECPVKGDNSDTSNSFGLLCDGQAKPVLFEGSNSCTFVSRSIRIHLRPVIVLHNLLPYTTECRSDRLIQLPPGEHCHLSGFGSESRPQLLIRNYLSCDWEASLEDLCQLSEPLNNVLFRCAGQNLHIGLHVRVLNGSLHASLYASYWMVNNTGLEISYLKSGGDDAVVVRHPADHTAPLIFSHGDNSLSTKRKISVRIADSSPSARFSLDTAGNSGLVTCTNAGGPSMSLSVQISLSLSGLTRHVVFSPSFVVMNKAEFSVELCEVSGDRKEWLLLVAGDCRPLWPSAERPTYVCRVADTTEESAEFGVCSPGRCMLQVNNRYGGIEVDVQVSAAATLIVLHQFSEVAAAVLIVNTLAFTVMCGQKGAASGEPMCSVPSHHSCLFAWRRPTDDRQLVWSCSSFIDRVAKLEEEKPVEFAGPDGAIFYCVSFLDGQQRTLLFTDDCSTVLRAQNPVELEQIETELQMDIDHIGISLVNNVTRCDILYISITGSGIVWEAQRAKGKRFRALDSSISTILEDGYTSFCEQSAAGEKDVQFYQQTLANGVKVNFGKLLLLSPHRRYLRRTCRSGVWLRLAMSPHQRRLHVLVNQLQMDNQLDHCVFPVVMAPIQPSLSVVGDSVGRPFAEASLIETLSEHSSVCQFKYAHVLVQEFHIRLEIGLLARLAEMFADDESSVGLMQHSGEVGRDLEAAKKSLSERVAVSSEYTDLHFFDDLHFSPLKVHLSFSMVGDVSTEGEGTAAGLATGFVDLLLQSVGVTATDIDDVIFRLAFFERLHQLMSFSDLVSQAQAHYISQALRQMYVLVLGLDVIGNPYGLVLGIGDGVSDFFYEPVQGAIQGPGEFVEGLALGVRSLLSHAVGGTAGAVSRITGTLGKGVAALTLDEEFRRNRREQISRQPSGLASGLAHSGRSLVMGVYDGITGVVRKPIEGAQRDGAVGFLKGVGVGVAGLIARPASGAIDFASGSLNAVRRSLGRDETGRLRPPRHFFADGILRPYVLHQAEGARIFKQVGNGRYVNTDQYLAHCVCSHERQEVLIVTDHRLLLASLKGMLNSWQLEWKCLLNHLDGPASLNSKGIQLPLPPNKSNTIYSFFGRNVVFKQINIDSSVAAQWILNKIDEAIDQLEV